MRSPESELSYSAMRVFLLGLAMVVTMTHEKTMMSATEALVEVKGVDLTQRFGAQAIVWKEKPIVPAVSINPLAIGTLLK